MSLEHSPDRDGASVGRALSIDEFCHANGISRSMYYKLRDLGIGPREMHVNTAVRITPEACHEWRLAREADAR
jgi:hypothetical protein